MVTSSRLSRVDDESDLDGSAPYDYPLDEFDIDDWAGPVGAHRAARKGWLVAFPWLAAAAAILLITGVALVLGLGHHRSSDTAAAPSKSTSSRSASPAATGSASTGAGSSTTSAPGTATSSSGSATTSSGAGTVNRQRPIHIVNSTRRNGVAHTLQTKLNGAGWNVTSVSTYRKGSQNSGVFYRDSADAATANALAKLYGLTATQSSAWNSPVTLMIGPGFQTP